MIPKIWFIKNMTHEAAGLFSSFAEKESVSFEIVDLHRGEKFPEIFPGQAVVVLGGPDSANDTSPKILSELEALRGCLDRRVPCLGVCLGLQLLVKAAGGSVRRNNIKEIGFRGPEDEWFDMTMTAAGKKDPLMAGIPDPCRLFQLHGETVDLTASMACLARGKYCENQIVKVGEGAYGIQGHVELSERMFEDWLAADEDLRRMDAGFLRRDFETVRKELELSSATLFKNFLKISKLLG